MSKENGLPEDLNIPDLFERQFGSEGDPQSLLLIKQQNFSPQNNWMRRMYLRYAPPIKDRSHKSDFQIAQQLTRNLDTKTGNFSIELSQQEHDDDVFVEKTSFIQMDQSREDGERITAQISRHDILQVVWNWGQLIGVTFKGEPADPERKEIYVSFDCADIRKTLDEGRLVLEDGIEANYEEDVDGIGYGLRFKIDDVQILIPYNKFIDEVSEKILSERLLESFSELNPQLDESWKDSDISEHLGISWNKY